MLLAVFTPDLSEYDMDAPTPSGVAVDHVLGQIGDMLGSPYCWLYRADYYFVLPDGWRLRVRPESARRFRLEACRGTEIRGTVFVREGDDDRLAVSVAGLVRGSVPV